jgi:SAM-dependent methyltransferase
MKTISLSLLALKQLARTHSSTNQHARDSVYSKEDGFMRDSADSRTAAPKGSNGDGAEEFWRRENLRFAEPHYRTRKLVRIIEKLARGRQCSLLDLGCGPAALGRMLPANVDYYGIDIAIQDPAPNLLEADLRHSPIKFDDRHFDIVIGQGIFEYVGDAQSQKFEEIASILNPDGRFVGSYWNFEHRKAYIYSAFSNVQPFGEFRGDLARHFKVDRYFPASHNWHHSGPSRPITSALNRPVNFNIPFVSPTLAVEYFFLCSPK